MTTSLNPQLVTAMQQAGMAMGRGQWPQAEYHYRQAIMLAPADPVLPIGLGHVLRQMQRPAEAKAQFTIAARLAPGSADARYGLGLACQDMMDMAGAEDAYRAALARNSGMLPAALGLATVCNYTNRPDETLALLENVSAPDARAGAAIEQARGTAYTLKEQHEAALARFERALALEPRYAEAAHSRAIAQQYLGREEEALAGLRQVVKDNPANLMAHHNLNQLLYRLRRDDEFLRSYDEAAAKLPGMPHLALAKAALLVRSERHAEALALFEQTLKQTPGDPMVLQGMAVAQLKLQQVDAAIASYEAGLKRLPQDVNMLTGVAAAYLIAREPKKAEAAAQRALQVAPVDQTGLCLLGTAWRLMEDGREHDLLRYDDFIQVFDLEPPPGFSDMATFCGELDQWLGTQHRDEREHIDQSLRGGTQTAGDLLRPGRHVLLDGLRQRIEEAVRLYISRLPQGPRHPFLGRRGRDIGFAGSWSSRLKDRGFHANHIHPAGWISSALYLALPETVENTSTQEGWIKFGEPGYDVGLKDPVRRTVQPRVGRLVLFPSYTWHGTIPFHASQDRTTIAFDAVPAA
jgi:tetratricopeptide (TPR) repeat protein